uniref:Protein SDE2 homolog n=1 Tax=Saccoglossus kowalevskii TaxID=10224 RepID=A0ABM0GS22_SACKO|nr:PREDICTED: protein SDE2 homolog [Saccoglossus kowalevskii]
MKLAEWLSKQADKEREREEKKRAKLEKLASDPKHYFDDPKYHEQKQTIMENIDDALTQGMQASASEEPSTSGVSMKRKEQDDGISRKKQKMWVGIDLDSDSSSDEENFQSYLQRVKESDKSDMQKGDIPVQKDSRTTDNLQCSEEKKQEILDDTVISESASTDTITITESVNLEDYASAVDLEVLGLERLKYALTAVGLKCGGTLQERAQRLFSIKGLKHDQIDQSLFAKPSRGKAKRK